MYYDGLESGFVVFKQNFKSVNPSTAGCLNVVDTRLSKWCRVRAYDKWSCHTRSQDSSKGPTDSTKSSIDRGKNNIKFRTLTEKRHHFELFSLDFPMHLSPQIEVYCLEHKHSSGTGRHASVMSIVLGQLLCVKCHSTRR